MTDAIVDLLGESLAEAPEAVRVTQRLVSYGRDSAATGVFSAACQLRVLWGGDASVAALRAVPLPPAAKKVTFPDRSSFAVVSVPAWSAAPVAERVAAVRAFYRDTYWYDQAACSSPRTVFWVGPAAAARSVQEDFVSLLATDEIQREIVGRSLGL